MLTQQDVDLLEKRFKKVFAIKAELAQFKSDLMNVLDKILKTTEDTNVEVKILAHRSKDHTDRIDSLENIHPAGKHPQITS